MLNTLNKYLFLATWGHQKQVVNTILTLSPSLILLALVWSPSTPKVNKWLFSWSVLHYVHQVVTKLWMADTLQISALTERVNENRKARKNK